MATIPVQRSTVELNQELRDLGTRDLQLWSIGALVLMVVAVGFLALVVPNLMWSGSPVHVEGRYLPQLFTGFLALIVLFNIYALDQRRRLNYTRQRLVRMLLAADAKMHAAARDPLTDSFHRDYVITAIEREMIRPDHAPYTLVMIDLAGFRRINQQFGTLAGDHVLLVASKLIRSSTRGSDILCRYGGDEFLLILPETIPDLAKAPIARLYAAVAAWNRTTGLSYTLDLHIAVAAGPTRSPAQATLDKLMMEVNKQRVEHAAECVFVSAAG